MRLHGNDHALKGREDKNVELEWKKFRDAVEEFARSPYIAFIGLVGKL